MNYHKGTAVLEASTTTLSKSKVEYDAIRVFAAFSVIAVHVAVPAMGNLSASDNYNWWVANFYLSLFRSGIPLFLMLTGALLLHRATGLAFVKNRLVRVLLPFGFWTFVYLIAKNRIKDIRLEDYFLDLYHGNSYHFWYIYLILSIYFLMPLLRAAIYYVRPSATAVFLVICFTSFILKYISFYIPQLNYSIDYIIYVEYIVFGYCIAKGGSSVWWLYDYRIGLLLVICGFCITFLGTYFSSVEAGRHIEFFYQSSTTHIFLKSVGVWILFTNIAPAIPKRVAQILKTLSILSFGVFLIHPLVIEHVLVVRLGVSHYFIDPAVGIFISSVLCYGISFCILYLLSRLPLGKYTN